MVSFDPPYGFPLRRNGSCLSSESSCGRTWGHASDNFFACCPGNSVCPGATQKILNNVCCPSESDCTNPLQQSPHCAVANATLYNHTGYFCCLDGQTGFWTNSPKDAVGCSDGVPDKRGYSILNPISYSLSETATSTSSTLSTSSATLSTSSRASATTTAASDPSDSSGSSSNHVGAIAGGVVGGVAGVAIIGGLILYWLHRRRKDQSLAPAVAGVGELNNQYRNLHPTELHGHSAAAELDDVKGQQVHELPAER